MESCMAYIIDRRLSPKGQNISNRQKFIKRANTQIRAAVKEAIAKRNIKDINAGEKIKIPVKDLSEPLFGTSGDSGEREFVVPGNKKFVEGDKIDKPEKGGSGNGGGKEASEDGEGEDDFVFTLSRDEFLDFFFEDLELPDLVKKSMKEIKKSKPRRSGYSTVGNPTALDVKETLKKSMGRRMALGRPKNEEIDDLEEELLLLQSKKKKSDEQLVRLHIIEEEIIRLKTKQKAIPWVDPVDVKYRAFQPAPVPTTQAVVFFLMDVSGSMGEREKDIAKRFFTLLYLFLNRRYEKIEMVFIRHTQTAQEVDEDTFFNSRETGGTVISSALELADKIIKERYSNDWNIYISQASDGENWSGDSLKCKQILEDNILPMSQYYAYIEILSDREDGASYFMPKEAPELWKHYSDVAKNCSNFVPKQVYRVNMIWDVFRELFAKKGK